MHRPEPANIALFDRHAFRKHTEDNANRSVFNAALWDVMATVMATRSEAVVRAHASDFNTAFQTLMADSKFISAIGDVVDKVHGRHTIEIGIVDDDQRYHWSFSSSERAEMSMAVDHVTVNGSKQSQPTRLQYLLPAPLDGQPPNVIDSTLPSRLRRLSYITAERIGPREFYPPRRNCHGSRPRWRTCIKRPAFRPRPAGSG